MHGWSQGGAMYWSPLIRKMKKMPKLHNFLSYIPKKIGKIEVGPWHPPIMELTLDKYLLIVVHPNLIMCLQVICHYINMFWRLGFSTFSVWSV